jgi:hypothetical protein
MVHLARTLQASLDRHAIPLDENGFVDWLVDAHAGDCIAYYRGHLGFDRCVSSGVLQPQLRRKLTAVAHRVLVAAEQGLVFPVQSRNGEHDYLYLAIRGRHPLFVPPIAAERPVTARLPLAA